MATKISTELLIMILNNVKSIQDLYSSLLVNRIWCKVTIPILWELLFGQECCLDNKKLKKKALCIRTYISCMDTQARNLLIQNEFDLSSSPPQATFDYPSFTHKFIINNLVYFISTYSRQNNTSDDADEEIAKSRILFREICKLILNRCTFLDYFKLAGFFPTYSDLIGSIFNIPGTPKVFKKLESLTLIISDEQICPLFKSLKLICDNILNMDLSFDSDSQMQLLEELIRAQKSLENLSIRAACGLNCNSIFWAIISQKETLKSLSLRSVYFDYFKEKSPIGQFISLQELHIEGCGLNKLNSLLFASSFTQISSFHFIQKFGTYPQEFIIQIFESANTNLKNIYLYLYSIITSDIFSAILNCTKITKLTLSTLTPEQVIAIFNNNFNELRRFSFECGGEGFNADELLCRMAENIPESLETIGIRLGKFSVACLRIFFDQWCCKGGGGSKKIIVSRTELLFTLSVEHFKVIEEYGVQLDIE